MLSRRSEGAAGRAPDDDGDEVDDPKKAVVYGRFDRSAGLHKGLQRLRQLPLDVASSLDDAAAAAPDDAGAAAPDDPGAKLSALLALLVNVAPLAKPPPPQRE